MRVLLERDDGSEIEGIVLSQIVSAEEVSQSWPSGLSGEDDKDWNWPLIVEEHPPGAWKHYELQVEGRAQGLMIVKRRHELRAPANTGQNGCYIEYVAVAPWNRPPTGDTRFPRVKPVGLVLVGAAMKLSVQQGFDGRRGWHSKPGAERWYKNAFPGLWPGGPDVSEDGFEYFEVTTSVARQFLSRNESLWEA